MRIEQNYSLLKHNTFHLEVKTKYFVEYDNESALEKLLCDEYFFTQQFLHIGQGSNLLFLGDFDGIIVHSAIRGIEKTGEDREYVWLRAGAGTDWDTFVKHCVDAGLGGVENLSLIPGEVGASAVQNIGAYGVEVSGVIEQVHAINIETGQKRCFTNADCNYSYRQSFFKEAGNIGKYYITHVIYRLRKRPEYRLEYGNLHEQFADKPVTLSAVREAVIGIRRRKLPDPQVTGNAGSFFVNPCISTRLCKELQEQYPDMPHFPVDEEYIKIPAAWLIDRCGLKGLQSGGAAVHMHQPLVIVNQSGLATGQDIAHLAGEICRRVKDRFSIELQPEVNYI
ncbi:MAG: UDP-N-acetylmuramate dehydrogenase [Dysgonamonadaceae bacterium]|jgi:UDP-N-acetylmuramate dehydrogenase|nr:UDP-N-acetylmuramate dehydrogenase [Dysgonamonadaceae bacterium]